MPREALPRSGTQWTWCRVFALTPLALSLLTAQVFAQSAVLVVDSYNRKVHVAGQGNERRPVGGLAKLATTMVTLDWAEASKVGVNVLATVPDYAPTLAGASPLGLRAGDRLTLRDLIYASMMTSDDFAAITLGHFVGGDHLYRLGRGGQPLEEFARQMNALARREGATNTRFTSPHGAFGGRDSGYSTAADMARLALYALSRPAVRFYTNQQSRNVTVYRGGGSLEVPINNTNQLLGTDRVDGIKYSETPGAGACLVISAEKPSTVAPQGDGSSLIFRHRMVVVVLNSANPFGEARALLSQGWAAYDRWLAAGRPITSKQQMLNYF